MAMVRQGTFVGRLTRDPDAPKVLPNSGSTVVKFTIVCGRSKKAADGSWEDDPSALWLECAVFSSPNAKFNLAEFVAEKAKKGETVFVQGELKQESWEDKNGGGKRSKVVCEVREFQLLGGGSSSPREPINAEDPGETMKPRPQPQQQRPQQPARQLPRGHGYTPIPDDDIPFSWALPWVAGAVGLLSSFVV